MQLAKAMRQTEVPPPDTASTTCPPLAFWRHGLLWMGVCALWWNPTLVPHCGAMYGMCWNRGQR